MIITALLQRLFVDWGTPVGSQGDPTQVSYLMFTMSMVLRERKGWLIRSDVKFLICVCLGLKPVRA